MGEILPNVFAAPRVSAAEFASSSTSWKVLALASVWGIERNLLDKLNAPIPLELVDVFYVVAVIAAGVPFGIGMLYVVSWTTAVAARVLGAAIVARQIRAVLAASAVPRIGSVVLLLLLLAWTGTDFFVLRLAELMGAHPGSRALLLGVMLLDLWAMGVAVGGLAEVGRMSVGRTLLVYLLGAVPAIVVLLSILAAMVALS